MGMMMSSQYHVLVRSTDGECWCRLIRELRALCVSLETGQARNGGRRLRGIEVEPLGRLVREVYLHPKQGGFRLEPVAGDGGDVYTVDISRCRYAARVVRCG
jgi:hypothetical protein